MFWNTYVHNSIANSNITAIKICILKLYTCTAATRRPRMTTSDLMVYDSAVKLAAYRGCLKAFIPSSLWNLQLIFKWLYHFKGKIRLKIHTPFITNLSLSIIKILGNTQNLHHSILTKCHWNRPGLIQSFLHKWPYLLSAWVWVQLYFLILIMRMQGRMFNKIQLIEI
jgi:hypothetical protein